MEPLTIYIIFWGSVFTLAMGIGWLTNVIAKYVSK